MTYFDLVCNNRGPFFGKIGCGSVSMPSVVFPGSFLPDCYAYRRETKITDRDIVGISLRADTIFTGVAYVGTPCTSVAGASHKCYVADFLEIAGLDI